MTQKKLHPKVIKFKEFVKKHPKIQEEVRQGKYNWQEVFEEWYLLGEEDERWSSYKSETETKDKGNQESKSDLMNQVMGYLKTMDVNQMQHYIQSISTAIGAVQGVLSQFQSPANSTTPKSDSTANKPTHPFSFRKD